MIRKTVKCVPFPRLPKFYGIAYTDLRKDRHNFVLYPIGINLIVSFYTVFINKMEKFYEWMTVKKGKRTFRFD